MATCCSAHRQASVASCRAAIAPNHPTPNSLRSFHEEKRSRRLGKTRYSETAVMASQMARRKRLRRGGGWAAPRSMTCSTSARSSMARSTRSPTRARGATVMGWMLHDAEVRAPHPPWVIRSQTRSPSTNGGRGSGEAGDPVPDELCADDEAEHDHDRRVVGPHPPLEVVENVPCAGAEREVHRDRQARAQGADRDEDRERDGLAAGADAGLGDRAGGAEGEEQVLGID